MIKKPQYFYSHAYESTSMTTFLITQYCNWITNSTKPQHYATFKIIDTMNVEEIKRTTNFCLYHNNERELIFSKIVCCTLNLFEETNQFENCSTAQWFFGVDYLGDIVSESHVPTEIGVKLKNIRLNDGLFALSPFLFYLINDIFPHFFGILFLIREVGYACKFHL